MYWSYSFDYDWLISPDSEWLKSPDANKVKKTGLDCYKYVFFSRSGFAAKETDEIKHIELADLYR